MTDTKAVVVAPEASRAPALFEMKPQQMIAYASEIATALKSVVQAQKLYTRMGKKDHVWVEGWTTMGAMLGIVPEERETKRLPDGSYESKVALISVATGKVVGGGSALCSVKEANWRGKEEFSVRSMAITRATGKAFRLGYSWIMTLAGYSPTPAEEMPDFRGYHDPEEQTETTQANKASSEPVIEAQFDQGAELTPEIQALGDMPLYGKMLTEFGYKTVKDAPQDVLMKWLNSQVYAAKQSGKPVSEKTKKYLAAATAYFRLGSNETSRQVEGQADSSEYSDIPF